MTSPKPRRVSLRRSSVQVGLATEMPTSCQAPRGNGRRRRRQSPRPRRRGRCGAPSDSSRTSTPIANRPRSAIQSRPRASRRSAREKAEWLRYSATTAMLGASATKDSQHYAKLAEKPQKESPAYCSIGLNQGLAGAKPNSPRVADATKLTAGVGCRTFCREDMWSSNERRSRWWLSIDRFSTIDTVDPARNLLRRFRGASSCASRSSAMIDQSHKLQWG